MAANTEREKTSTSQRAKSIASGIRFLTIQNLVNSVLGFIFLAVLLRLLSPSQYGLYSGAVLVVGIGTSVASFGLPAAATRFVAMLSQDPDKLDETRAISRLILVLSLAFTSVVTVVFVLLSSAFSLYFTKNTGSAWIFALSGAWLFTGTSSGLFTGFLQGMKRYESLAKVLMISNLGMVFITVVGLMKYHSITVPVVAWVFYGALISIWGFSIARNGPLSRLIERT